MKRRLHFSAVYFSKISSFSIWSCDCDDVIADLTWLRESSSSVSDSESPLKRAISVCLRGGSSTCFSSDSEEPVHRVIVKVSKLPRVWPICGTTGCREEDEYLIC